ncbi:MAG: hypothetical protein EBR82_56670 [Caulobacteraceae bacterium]|nr:hypothetical protein [Caulobacteraceae bacterium]
MRPYPLTGPVVPLSSRGASVPATPVGPVTPADGVHDVPSYTSTCPPVGAVAETVTPRSCVALPLVGLWMAK